MGAGAGLGRAHAQLLASRGAEVVVNDMTEAAEIVAAGGEAESSIASVAEANLDGSASACIGQALGLGSRLAQAEVL